MRYLLDTNAVIALLNDSEGQVSQRVRTLLPADFGLSSIVMHELYFSAYKSQRCDRNLDFVDKLRFEVVPFEQEDSRHAGDIHCALAAQGVPIGGY
ncbi:MAG: PIN domain-containing protein, partial [Polaromonas sp.]|nr:PIN domain-containing protein [Polaromonas sp.]